MTAIDIDFEAAKQLFFDRRSVQRALDKGAADAMRKIGGYIRTTAKRSIRKAGKRSKASKPGKPPKSHTGHLRNKIFFVYDPKKKSVVTGPLLWKSPKSEWKPVSQPSNAATLELGGTMRGPTRIKSPGTGAILWGPAVTVAVAPRPYMAPALDKAIANGKLASSFKYMLKP